jgi:hypothetical protein
MDKGFECSAAKRECKPKNIELSPGKFLQTEFKYIDLGKNGWQNIVIIAQRKK